ncbi:glycosyltransferase family 4 protein [Rhizobium sp. NPDC090275]|uniref:glycosyltransferase family 4 protein n=1 Tax=Rhizobium sp. NPDC090275 TaxID=3364498 RepID=UPI00383A6A82
MTFDRSPGYVRARSNQIAKALAKSLPLDGVIAMGTDVYDLELAAKQCTVPIATYDDGTFALFLRYPDSDISALKLPDEEVNEWVELQKVACRRADVACVSTEWAKRSVIDDFGLAEDRVRAVGMGHKPRSHVRADRDFDRPSFLFVGVDWKRKNGDAVLAAFARVREQVPTATLSIVGMHPALDQPGVRGYGFLARENPESQECLNRLFAKATAFVLPSLFDPSPIAYLEAASAGLPVIATTCGGAGQLLGDAAISVNPYDHDALFQAMLALSDGQLARSMGAKALERSASSRWQDVAGRIVDALQASGRRIASPARRERLDAASSY